MGGSSASKPAAPADASPGLDGVVDRAAKRMGAVAVSGRYHKGAKQLTDDYNLLGDELGTGYNGTVYKACAKEGGKTFAVKDFKIRGVNKEKMDELEGECEIFLSMDHPHVARLVDVYQNREKLSLVMECMEGGELFDRVLAKKKYSEQDAADAAYQMLLSINYIHGHGIVHRDIKLENFLYESKDGDHLKLIDFGFSKIWDPSIRMKMSCGTLAYVAPEVLEKSYTSKCDIWSLGVVVFILLVGYMPFSGSEHVQMRKIKEGNFTVKDSFNRISAPAQDMMRRMIVVDANTRMSAEECLQHEFITGRSERAKASEGAEIDSSVVNSLCEFAQASKFRRACMSAMAWSLTNEERTELRQAFLDMDKTKSGTITLVEFKECIESRFEFTDEQVAGIFNAVDLSNTHEIQYSEFLAAMVASRVSMHDDLLKATFRRFDADNTGFIEVGDLKTVLGETFEGEEVTSLMAEADTNGDGKISYEEFIAYAKGHDGSEKVREVGGRLVDQEHAKATASGMGPTLSMSRKK